MATILGNMEKIPRGYVSMAKSKNLIYKATELRWINMAAGRRPPAMVGGLAALTPQ